jgi:hypothetical protein
VLLQDVAIDEVGVAVDYADLFLVVREGDEAPGPNDWEATVRTSDRQHIKPGRYALSGTTADDIAVAGPALLRFSDGHQHLFRGDGALAGADAVTA